MPHPPTVRFMINKDFRRLSTKIAYQAQETTNLQLGSLVSYNGYLIWSRLGCHGLGGNLPGLFVALRL